MVLFIVLGFPFLLIIFVFKSLAELPIALVDIIKNNSKERGLTNRYWDYLRRNKIK